MTRDERLDEWTRSKIAEIMRALDAEAAGDAVTASQHYRAAAELEGRIGEELVAASDPGFMVSGISATSCWLKAGEQARALGSARRFLTASSKVDLPESLRSELVSLLRRAVAGLKPAELIDAPEPTTAELPAPATVDLDFELHDQDLESYRPRLAETKHRIARFLPLGADWEVA